MIDAILNNVIVRQYAALLVSMRLYDDVLSLPQSSSEPIKVHSSSNGKVKNVPAPVTPCDTICKLLKSRLAIVNTNRPLSRTVTRPKVKVSEIFLSDTEPLPVLRNPFCSFIFNSQYFYHFLAGVVITIGVRKFFLPASRLLTILSTVSYWFFYFITFYSVTC